MGRRVVVLSPNFPEKLTNPLEAVFRRVEGFSTLPDIIQYLYRLARQLIKTRLIISIRLDLSIDLIIGIVTDRNKQHTLEVMAIYCILY